MGEAFFSCFLRRVTFRKSCECFGSIIQNSVQRSKAVDIAFR
jgi:hypothetical protein